MARRTAALLFAAVASHGAATNPLSSVISLLGELEAKIKAEGEVEEKAYKEFTEWCDDAARNKEYEVKTATANKEKLTAAISKAAGDIEAASGKIEELAAGIATDEADLKSATQIRKKELADFKASEAELMESIDTVGRAISIIEREMRKNPAAFAQVESKNLDSVIQTISTVVDAASFSTADKERLTALVQARDNTETDDEDLGAPAAAAYKSHSGGIIDVLEDLKEKAEEQLNGLRKAETNSRHNYEMLKQSLEDSMTADTKDMNDEKATQASTQEAKAQAEGDLAMTEKALADGQKALEVVHSDCMSTAADHEATVASRAEELKALAEAKKILLETTSGAEEQTYSFIELNGATATRSSLRTSEDLAKVEVVTLVKSLAREHHSAALAQLASRISAVLRFGSASGEDPFAKVKVLISDMIAKLQAEAGSEATEKAYCDEQLAKTEEKKSELQRDLEKLTSKIDQAVAASAGLKEDVKQLQAELASLMKSQAEMDKMRQDGHAAYVKAKSDLEAGLAGVRKALSVLREYYGGEASAAGAAMLQAGADLKEMMKQPAPPEKHEKAAGAGTSIIGILEVTESDFAKNLAAEETQEENEQSEYEQLTQENKISKTMKEQDVKYKTQEFKALDKSVSELSSDRRTTDSELSAVLEYYSKIQERCIAKPETYEERKRRRQAEIAGLKDALTILEDETAGSFAQRSKKGRKSRHFLAIEPRS